MPVQVSYPGVYIEEVPSGVHTITGVSTSIAAFFGRASKGPINKAVRLLSLSDYVRQFGEPHPKSDLAHSVRLFFANGGTECYVVRLARNAESAAVTLHDLNNRAVLVATAKAEGVWANTVRLEVDYNTPNPDETFNLRVIQEADGRVVTTESILNLSMDPYSPRFAPSFVTQSSDLIDLELDGGMGDPGDQNAFINAQANSSPGFSQARRPLGVLGTNVSAPNSLRKTLNDLISAAAPNTRSKFEISVNGAPYALVDLHPLTTLASGSLDNIREEIEDRINDALATVTPVETVTCEFLSPGNINNLLTIVSNSGDLSSVRVRRASSNDISAALMLGVDQGGIEPVRRSNFRPAPTATFLRLGDTPPASRADMTQTLNRVADLDQSAITDITIDGTSVALNESDPEGFNLVSTANSDDWFKSKPVSGSPHGDNDGVREKLGIIARAINARADLPWRAEVWGYHLAVIPKEGTINKRPNSIVVTGSSDFTNGLTRNVRQYSLGTASETGPGTFVSGQIPGDDGDAPDVPDFLGNPDTHTGFYALDAADIFNLMVIPGDDEVGQATFDMVWGPASTYCQGRRAFLLIDPPTTWSRNGRPEVVQDTTLVNSLRALVVKDHSAVFYPRLRYAANGLIKTIGPSGAIAGLMARIDSTRGVWKAPAGMEADIRGILGLEVKLTDMENGVLNKLGANCLRIFPSGFANWGARTLDGADDIGSEWKYVPIRRLALFLEESLYRGTKWVVFEPNDEPLWAQIRLNLNAFMMGLFRQGAFQGSTPDQAFYVKCDGETTTQADRNLGIVNIEVGFAPLKPAEFVVIKIQQIAGEL